MKRYMKKLLAISAVCFAVGIADTVVGGIGTNWAALRGGFRIDSDGVHLGEDAGDGWAFLRFGSDYRTYTHSSDYNYTFSDLTTYSVDRKFTEEIHSLNIDVSRYGLSIREGEEFSFNAFSSAYPFEKYEVSNGVLTLKETSGSGSVNFSRNDPDSYAELVIPHGYTFDDIQISTGSSYTSLPFLTSKTFSLDSGSGFTYMENLKADTVTMDTGSGEVNVNYLKCGTGAIDTGSGYLSISEIHAEKSLYLNMGSGSVTMMEGNVANLTADMGSGPLDYYGSLTGENKFSAGSGYLRLDLTGSSHDFNWMLSPGSGGISLDDKYYTSRDNEVQINNNSENKMELDGGSGTMEIYFSE